MSVDERDPYTGHRMTGHDWNGIKELNTRIPRVVLIALALTFTWSLYYWYKMPSFPIGGENGYLQGTTNFNQRDELVRQLAVARMEKSEWTDKVENYTFDQIQNDPSLMQIVEKSGSRLFADNCAGCHGPKGRGHPPFPNLTDSAWLWGGEADQILKTLRVGINANHPETRVAQMMPFGSNGALTGEEVDGIILYLQSQRDPSIGNGSDAAELLTLNAGRRAYEANCQACHGNELQGNPALGAPNLKDAFWLYGGDEASIRTTLMQGRAGLMPSWEARLSPAELKLLTLYVQSLN